MKKTLLITLDFPPKIGGVSLYLKKISDGLPQDKIIILAPKEKETDKTDSGRTYKIYRKKLLSTFPLIWPKWLFLILKTRKIIKKEGIEQILVGQILPIGTVALIIKKLWRIPYIVSTHAMDITILKNSYRKTKLAQKILLQSKKIVTVSNFTRHELQNLGVPGKKITIISPATDIQFKNYPDKQEDIKKRYNLENKKILLTIGRIVERKGHLYVLRSLKKIKEHYQNIVYLIGSTGPFMDVLKIYINKNNLENNVIFTGNISPEDLPSFYKLCDIFIMPSLELINGDVEGFGIVYLEANAFAKPVIATRYGGIEDAVIDNETGILIDPKDTESLSKAILELLDNNKLARRLGEQGKKRVIEKFNWNTRSDKMEKLLA